MKTIGFQWFLKSGESFWRLGGALNLVSGTLDADGWLVEGLAGGGRGWLGCWLGGAVATGTP